MPRNLASWQLHFLEGMRNREFTPGLFLESPGPSLSGRLRVYWEGFEIRVRESLTEDFSLTIRLVGQQRFPELVAAFLQQRNSYEIELGELTMHFADFHLQRAGAALARALRLDLLATEARRSEEPEPQSLFPCFGLHPSARFFASGYRNYVLWRFDGFVRRERISLRLRALFRCFETPSAIEGLTEKLETLGEDPAFVQGAVAEWSSAGLITSYSPRS